MKTSQVKNWKKSGEKKCLNGPIAIEKTHCIEEKMDKELLS